MIAISIDTEWSPDELIEEALEMLNEHKITATFFATNKVNVNNHELALHPNFLSVDSYEDTLAELMQLFPYAKGVRSHRLLCDEKLLPIYRRLGIVYESSYQMMGLANIRPFFMECGIMQIPLFYMDRIHVEERIFKRTFSREDVNLLTGGVKVFDFHPIHLFLNTRKISTYARAKQFYKNPERLRPFVNGVKPGVRNFFLDLLDAIEELNLSTFSIIEIYRTFRRTLKRT